MTRRHIYTHTLSLSLGGDEPTWEGEATVCYAVSWGRPAQGPTYACGGVPADPDEIDDITVTHIDGAVVVGAGLSEEARALEAVIECNDALLSELLQAAVEDDIAARDDAMERRWEERRLES